MAFTIASLAAKGAIEILRTEEVATSFPDFVSVATRSGLAIEVARSRGKDDLSDE